MDRRAVVQVAPRLVPAEQDLGALARRQWSHHREVIRRRDRSDHHNPEFGQSGHGRAVDQRGLEPRVQRLVV
ncbi:MAG: hypothetical protein JNK64_16530 [Myxococcales bacterium]|nr:hypothetical protein [Myxococcales bacterium]